MTTNIKNFTSLLLARCKEEIEAYVSAYPSQCCENRTDTKACKLREGKACILTFTPRCAQKSCEL